MKYKGIIFDLDGVICSTDHYHYLAWKALADRLGVYFDETINNRLRGVSRMASLDIVLERSESAYSPEEKAAFAEEKNNTYRELLKRMSPAELSPEVKETLDALRERGLLLGIGSSSKNTKFILSRIGLGDYFDKISEYLGLAPADCLVVEDAKAGIEAARAAGMDSAAIGDAAGCGLATYDLGRFSDLLSCVD